MLSRRGKQFTESPEWLAPLMACMAEASAPCDDEYVCMGVFERVWCWKRSGNAHSRKHVCAVVVGFLFALLQVQEGVQPWCGSKHAVSRPDGGASHRAPQGNPALVC